MRDGLPWSSLRGKADISYFHALVLNRRMRIRTFGGVGGVIPLPDCCNNIGKNLYLLVKKESQGRHNAYGDF